MLSNSDLRRSAVVCESQLPFFVPVPRSIFVLNSTYCSTLLALENPGVIAAGINKGLLSSAAICLRLTVGETN